VIIAGDAEFFSLTKRLHNRLHGAQGDGGPVADAERSVYERRCASNAAALVEMLRPDDVVIPHDPQTAGMLPALRTATDVPLNRKWRWGFRRPPGGGGG
jgi:trehalose synthase